VKEAQSGSAAQRLKHSVTVGTLWFGEKVTPFLGPLTYRPAHKSFLAVASLQVVLPEVGKGTKSLVCAETTTARRNKRTNISPVCLV